MTITSNEDIGFPDKFKVLSLYKYLNEDLIDSMLLPAKLMSNKLVSDSVD